MQNVCVILKENLVYSKLPESRGTLIMIMSCYFISWNFQIDELCIFYN